MVRYLNSADQNPRRITKADKNFSERFDFKDIQIPFKIIDIHKIEKKSSISMNVFVDKIKEKYPIYVSKQCCEEKHIDLLLVGEGEKLYVLLKDFNTFMFDHSLHCGRRHFCRCCSHAYITEEIFKSPIKDSFKINGKQKIKMPKKMNMLNSKILKQKENHHL